MEELKRKAGLLVGLAVVLLAYTVWSYQGGHLWSALAVDLMVINAAALVVWPRTRWLMPVVVPLIISGALAQFHEQAAVSFAVVAPAALGLASAVLLAAGVQVGRYLDIVLKAIGRALEAAVGGFAFVVVVLPAWAWTRLRRREVLRTAGAAAGPTWSTRVDNAGPTSLAASPEVVGASRTFTGRVTWAFGCVALLLVVNFGAGWVWDQAYPTSPPEAADRAGDQPRVTETPLPRDPRADTPAMADAPWRDEYFDEIRRTPGGYWPFTEYRPEPYRSTYVNQDGWNRRSYEPAGDPDTMPVVWMFGGSTTWGEGQRDEHTIASYLSRIAEDEGVPLQIRNYGLRGWVHYQEMTLYEQQLASETPPDLAVFYDGANEITSQSLVEVPVPVHTLTYAYAKKLTGAVIATQAEGPPPVSTMDDAIDAYKEHSAVHKIVGYFRSQAAGAAPTQDADDNGLSDDITTQTNADEDGQVSNYEMTEQDGIDAAAVYERGRDLTLHLSKEHDVDTLLFWQPVRYKGPPQEAAAERIDAPTIDISDALEGHDDLFIDGGHTNEEGARIVAEKIWESLGPKVRAWYRANR